MAEGGIRNALIVSGPIVKRTPGSIHHGVLHVADIMPTLLEVAGASYPKTLNGQEPPPLIGKSWVKLLAGEEESPRSDQDYMAWEMFGNRAVRQGDWKLRWQYKPYGTEEWELFNLAEDVAERHDLAAAQPEKVKALLALWDDYVSANNVILPSRVLWEGWRKSCRTDIRWRRVPAAHLQEAVHPAAEHAGRPEAVIAPVSTNSNQRTAIL
jgi:arylsulfatase A-like enzyme